MACAKKRHFLTLDVHVSMLAHFRQAFVLRDRFSPPWIHPYSVQDWLSRATMAYFLRRGHERWLWIWIGIGLAACGGVSMATHGQAMMWAWVSFGLALGALLGVLVQFVRTQRAWRAQQALLALPDSADLLKAAQTSPRLLQWLNHVEQTGVPVLKGDRVELDRWEIAPKSAP